jgi:hypothetical protein
MSGPARRACSSGRPDPGRTATVGGVRLDGSGPVALPSGPPPEPASPADRPAAQPTEAVRPRRPKTDPGAVLAQLTVLPAVAAAGWLAASYPLVRMGHATPVPALLAAAVVIGALLLACRGLPAVRGAGWGSVLATAAVPIALTVLGVLSRAEPAVVRRDQGVYAMTAYWLAGHGGLGTMGSVITPGGADALLSPAGPGFYLHGGSVVPQFMSGTSTALLPGGWVAGFAGIASAAPVYAGAALLAVAGLVARLVGPRWAPAAALALGLCQPQLLAARTTLSEPLAQLLMFGALCLLVDALGPRPAPGRPGPLWTVRAGGRHAAVAGLLLGLGLLVRIDAARELALAIPMTGWLAARHRPQWKWLALGCAVGIGYGVLDALGPSSAYVATLSDLIVPILIAAPVLAAATWVAAWWLRHNGLPAWVRRPAPVAAGLAVLAAAVFLALRPLLQTAREGINVTTDYLASLQREQGLPLDPTRTYAEQSLRWVSWYLGWAVLLLAAAAAVVGTWRVLRTRDDRWALALAVPLASTALVLYRPGITPDHPWADRRLVPTVLPTVVVLAVAAVAAVARGLPTAAQRLAPGVRRIVRPVARVARPAVVGVGVAVLVVPAVTTSWPLLGARTETGELGAILSACSAFGPGDVALAVDARTRQELMPALRTLCEVPTYAVPGDPTDATATPSQVRAAASRVRAGGGRPILVAQSGSPLPALTAAPQREIVAIHTSEHERSLERRPKRLQELSIEIWIAPAG